MALTPEEKENKRIRQRRRLRLLAILKAVSEGKMDSSKMPTEDIFAQEWSPRLQYRSPLDRSSYNYGYMTSMEQGVMDSAGY